MCGGTGCSHSPAAAAPKKAQAKAVATTTDASSFIDTSPSSEAVGHSLLPGDRLDFARNEDGKYTVEVIAADVKPAWGPLEWAYKAGDLRSLQLGGLCGDRSMGSLLACAPLLSSVCQADWTSCVDSAKTTISSCARGLTSNASSVMQNSSIWVPGALAVAAGAATLYATSKYWDSDSLAVPSLSPHGRTKGDKSDGSTLA